MGVANEIEIIHSLVLELLRKDERYRDSDDILFAKIIAIHYGGSEKIKNITLFDYLVDTLDSNKNIPSYDSVARARRKVQEHHEETRGKKWYIRHKYEQEVKQVLIDFSR